MTSELLHEDGIPRSLESTAFKGRGERQRTGNRLSCRIWLARDWRDSPKKTLRTYPSYFSYAVASYLWQKFA